MGTTIISTPMSQVINTKPVDPNVAKGNIYFGQQNYSYTPGAAAQGGKPGTSAAATFTAEDRFLPKNESWTWYSGLDEGGKKLLYQIAEAKYGYWEKDFIPGLASEGVQMSEFAGGQGRRVSPLQALYDFYLAGDTSIGVPGSGSSASGGGSRGGGGGPAVTASVNLTDPGTAKTLINQTLQQYLGRSASQKEIEKFTAALNQAEMANPKQANIVGTTQISSGGFNPATFAQEYAQAEEGAAEYQAATTFLDSFIGALENPIQVV